jgi:hypothetical protein
MFFVPGRLCRLTDSTHKLSGAARVTLEGAAELTLSQSYDIDGAQGALRMVGTADFARDRCRLAGNGEVAVFDGGDEYRLVEGHWYLRRSGPGRRSSADPSWLLGLLADARGVRELRDGSDGEIHGELAYELAAATLGTGLFSGCVLPFTVLVVDGSVRTGHVEKVDSGSGRVVAVDHLELKPVPSVAPIELPPTRDVQGWFCPNSE